MVIALLLWLSATQARPAVRLWDHFADTIEAPPGRLVLLLIDLDGDGRKEIFLAPGTTCGNGGCGWYVYSPTAKPNQVRYLGDTAFSPAGYRVDPGTGALISCVHISGGSCALSEDRIQAGTLAHRDLGECMSDQPACKAELDRIAQWQNQQRQALYFAEVPASANFDQLKWSGRDGVAVSSAEIPNLNRLVVSARE
jgi:hypothetical protein